MGDNNIHIGQRVFALFLVFLLFIPLGFSIAHAFEDHVHRSCNETMDHLHEQEISCELCDYQPTTRNAVIIHNNSDYPILSYDKVSVPVPAYTVVTSIISYKRLRAPPLSI